MAFTSNVLANKNRSKIFNWEALVDFVEFNWHLLRGVHTFVEDNREIMMYID